MAHVVPVAAEVDEDKVTPGVLGFIVFAVMALAVWGLMKSMNRHMRKVDFKEDTDPTAGASGKGAAGSRDSANSGGSGNSEGSGGSGGKASPAKG